MRELSCSLPPTSDRSHLSPVRVCVYALHCPSLFAAPIQHSSRRAASAHAAYFSETHRASAHTASAFFRYGFEKPSAIQQRAIRPIVLGRDVRLGPPPQSRRARRSSGGVPRKVSLSLVTAAPAVAAGDGGCCLCRTAREPS